MCACVWEREIGREERKVGGGNGGWIHTKHTEKWICVWVMDGWDVEINKSGKRRKQSEGEVFKWFPSTCRRCRGRNQRNKKTKKCSLK